MKDETNPPKMAFWKYPLKIILDFLIIIRHRSKLKQNSEKYFEKEFILAKSEVFSV